MALLAPVVVIVILLSGGRESEAPSAAIRVQPVRVTAQASTRVVLATRSRDAVARTVFDALKAGDLERMEPALPTEKDILWLLEALREHAPEMVVQAEADLVKKGGAAGLLRQMRERGAASFHRVREEAELDWSAAVYAGLHDELSTQEVEHGVEKGDVVFRVRVRDDVTLFRLPNCLKTDRGWVSSGRVATRDGVVAEARATPGTPAVALGQVALARAQMRTFETAIQMYYLSNGRLPTSLEVLTEGDQRTGEAYLDSVPSDPWGHPYELRLLDKRKFLVVSAGPDGVADTEDDLVWPR